MKKITKYLSFFAAITQLTFASSVYAQTFYSLGSDKEVLGAGFETELRIPRESCLDGEWVFQGGSQGGLAYRGAFDTNTMINTLAGSVKAGVNLVIFGGSVKFSMRNRTTESNRTAASTIELNYTKGSYNFENRTVKPDIASLIQTNPQAVRDRCGDAFIHNKKLGSNLYVTAKLHFKDREEYEWYQTKIKIKVLFWSKTITKTKEFYEATKNAVYSVQVNTDGGLTPRLAALTAGGPRYCRTNNIDSCLDYADELFSYLLDGGDYPNELNDSHLNTITYDVESYERSGHFDIAYAGTANIAKKYIELSERLRAYQDFVNNEIESLRAFIAVTEDPVELAAHEARLQERNDQITALDNSAEYCYTLPGLIQCENNMEAAIAQVN